MFHLVCIGFWSSWVDNLMGRKPSGWSHSEHSNLWSYSTWKAVISGVPQDFILGPVLLNILINDLEKDMEYTHKFSGDSDFGGTANTLGEWPLRGT